MAYKLFEKLMNWIENNFKKAVFIFICLIFGIPLIIQCLYWLGRTPFHILTDFSADSLLTYFSSILVLIGTLILGLVAWQQNKKSNDINERLLNLESIGVIPFVNINENFRVCSYSEKNINFLLKLSNKTKGVIVLEDVTNLKFIHRKSEIKYTEKWLDGNMMVVGQEVEIDFISENKDGLPDFEAGFIHNRLCTIKCELSFELSYLGSTEKYKQTSTFFIYIEKDSYGKILKKGTIGQLENIISKITS